MLRTEFLEDRRLLAAGDLDTTFGTAGLATATFQSAVAAQTSAIEPDGKLLVAGGIQINQGSPDALAVARFNSDGSLDTTFGNGGTVVLANAGAVQHVVIETDGGILLAGIDNTAHNLLTRLTDTGAVDTTFGSGGSVTLPGGNGAGVVLESDGKIVAVGDEPGAFEVARLQADGSFDSTFGTAGVSVDPMPQGSNGSFYGVADAVVQPDGAILSSAMLAPSNVAHFQLARFTPEGGLDTTFGDQGIVDTPIQVPFDSAETLNLEPDGKILLAGSTPLPLGGGNGNLALERYNSNGTPDTTFGTSGELTTPYLGWVNKAMVEPSGKVVLAGTVANVGNELIRLNADGTFDDTFGTNGVVKPGYSSIFSSVVEQTDGKYVFSASQSDAMVAERFSSEAPVTTSGIGDITLQENSAATVLALPDYFQGGSVSAGQLTYSVAADSNPGLFGSVTIDPQSGNLTLAFAANQVGSAQLTIKATDPDGTFVETSFKVTLIADEPFGPGTLDPTFGTGGAVVTPVTGIFGAVNFAHVLASGQILAAGDVQPSGSNGNEVVALYNADGSLDTNFGQNGFATPVMNGAGGAALQSDGKIVVSGDSTTSGTSSLVRFNADGSLDTSFGADGVVTTPGANGGQVAVQSDGKIVVINSDNQGNLGEYGLVRYNPGGTLDTTFGTGGMVSTVVGVGSRSIPFGLVIQPDGKILVAGWAWNGSKSDFGVVRYNTDGTLDSSFGNGGIVMTSLSGGDDEANDITLQPDGKIVVSGYSSGIGALVRYDADGTLDTSFGNQGIELVPTSGALYQPVVQPNGDIVVAGDIGNFGFGVFRFLPDGNPDTTFTPTGYSKVPNLSGLGEAISVEPDGDYLVAGTGNTSPSASGTFALARFDGSFAPTTSGIGDVHVAENSTPTVISLVNDFQGGSVPASGLTYSIVADSNVSLFASATIDPVTGDLTLNYAPNQSGSAQLTIQAADPDGGTVDATFHVTVGAALTAAGATVRAVEGTSFSGTLATFTDTNSADTAADFAATIDWGDGASSAGTITAVASGGFAVVGSHVYAEEAQNTPVTVVIHEQAGAQATATSTANISDAKLHIAAATTLAPSGGIANNLLVATFTDDGGPEPVSDYSATIDWGDGATSAGSITGANGMFDIAGSHQYAHAGTFVVGVSVSDDGGSVDGLVEQAGVQLTPHQQYVIAVYNDVLGRAPDSGGLAYWSQQLDSGAAISSVAQAIAHSDEYYANFVIKPDYLKLLGRAADAAGVEYWTGKMDAGTTDQQIEADLVSSDEFFTAAGGNNTAWIDHVYTLLLGRAADPSGETYWNGQLAAGQTLNDVAQRIASSAENNTQLINADYFHYLGRAADPSGLAFWLKEFDAGQTNEDVIAGFTGSVEYYTEHTS